MPDFAAAAQTFDTLPKLRSLWTDLENNQPPPGWTVGPAFEFLVLQAFQLDGLQIHWPYTVTLQDIPKSKVIEQIDGLVWLDGVCFMVESKNLKEDVEFGVIAKLIAHASRRPSAMVGLVFSRSGFTDAAKTMARFVSPQTVLLWEGSELSHALGAPGRMSSGLRSKLQAAYKYAIPDYHLITGTLNL